MSRMKYCELCGSVFSPQEDNIEISRHVRNKDVVTLTYHTECFEEVAGNTYIPYINAGALPNFNYEFAPSPNNPGNPGVIATKRDLEHYCRGLAGQLFQTFAGGPNPPNIPAMEAFLKNDFRQRVPMGIKTDVEVSPDPHSMGDYKVVLTFEGAEKVQVAAIVTIS